MDGWTYIRTLPEQKFDIFSVLGVLQLRQANTQSDLAGPLQKTWHLSGATIGRTNEGGHHGCIPKIHWIWHILSVSFLYFEESLQCFSELKAFHRSNCLFDQFLRHLALRWGRHSPWFYLFGFILSLWTGVDMVKGWTGEGEGVCEDWVWAGSWGNWGKY